MSPKLVVRDADAALTFYAEVLGARLLTRHTMGESVVFAALELPDGGQVQVKDPDDADPAPAGGGTGVILDVLTDDPDAVMARALERGAEEVFPVDDQPYGSRQGRFRDPFGHQWIVGTEVTMADADVQAALDEWAQQA
ncbi:Glyoxalase family protein [Serinicoccus hydrothermalis]|uniref:Glyoxalase family protein n=1 Tax=Serinicoccus hydrothermalis TaxID=1758689 RepID=A0A1B1NC22_9MICO|nr:Glyoxalase family protein [Serinicoccus hydrothermalis]